MKNINVRRIHFWLSVAVAIPLLIVAISGIFIGLRGAMPTITVPLSWMGNKDIPETLPMTTFLQDSHQTIWIGNAQGLSKIQQDQVTSLPVFQGQEIVSVAQFSDNSTPIVATKMAVWVNTEGKWSPPLKGRVRMLSRLPNGNVLAIVGGRGEFANGQPMITEDGVNWHTYQIAVSSNQLMPPLTDGKIPLHMFMRELHSGAYFVGKGLGEWIYNSFMGVMLIILIITGFVMWLKATLRKRHQTHRG